LLNIISGVYWVQENQDKTIFLDMKVTYGLLVF